MKFQITAVVLTTLALEASAFWRLPCRGRTTLQRIDPIVSPGRIAGHVHAVHGSNAISANATSEDLMAAKCSSCQVKQDLSAYWTPALYFKNAYSGKLEVVPQTGGMLVYYIQRGEKVQAAPAGLRMLAGDPFIRDFPYRLIEKSHWTEDDKTEAALRQKAVGFNCLDYKKDALPAFAYRSIPENAAAICPDGLRGEVFFPSCWDGKRLDSTDHKDHMRYPDLVDDGECPPTHPTRIVSLFFETIWNVNYFNGKEGQFVFADGDPTGYGYHGDFMNGWDQDVLERAVKECTNTSGEVTDCPIFDLSTEEDMESCKVEYPDFEEDVHGPMDTLPGCNPITSGPERALANSCNKNPVTIPKEIEEDKPSLPVYLYDVKDTDSTTSTTSTVATTTTSAVATTSTVSTTSTVPTTATDALSSAEDVTTSAEDVTTSAEDVTTSAEATTSTDAPHLHVVVVTVTQYTTVDVYATVEPTPTASPITRRRKHNHGGSRHHHHV